MKTMNSIEIMDTTLRDGEQTSGVSFMPHEKLLICRALLEDLRVDRVEVASARVSEGEMEAVQRITRWAATKDLLDRVEILGFVDNGKSLDWIEQAGGRVINMLAKGSQRHCEGQLGKTLEEHAADIRRNVEMAAERGIKVNLYLEDWSGGMKTDSPTAQDPRPVLPAREEAFTLEERGLDISRQKVKMSEVMRFIVELLECYGSCWVMASLEKKGGGGNAFSPPFSLLRAVWGYSPLPCFTLPESRPAAS